MSDVDRIFEIAVELNNGSLPPVLVQDPSDPVNIAIALLEADHVIEEQFKRYQGTVKDEGLLQRFEEHIRKSYRKQVLEAVVQHQAKT